MKNLELGHWVLIGMVLGIGAGAAMGQHAAVLDPLGQLFIKLITMLVVPLIAVSIVSGAASIGEAKSAGKMGIITFAYFLLTTSVAVVIGLVLGELFQPGRGIELGAFAAISATQSVEDIGGGGFAGTILSFIPENPVVALASGNILQILVFCLFFGIGLSLLPREKSAPLLGVVDSAGEVLLWMIKRVMLIAPFGVFALMAEALGTFGWSVIGHVLELVLIFIVGLLLQVILVYFGFLKLASRISIKRFFKAMLRPQTVAFSTASSLATLPINMETCEQDLGISRGTVSFVLPLGATINMDGNSMYYALGAVFLAQAGGIDLGMAQYVAIITTATMGSIGQAGVPGPSLLLTAVLVSAGIPLDGLALLYGADRIFDMARTVVNITGDASCACIVDHLVRERNV